MSKRAIIVTAILATLVALLALGWHFYPTDKKAAAAPNCPQTAQKVSCPPGEKTLVNDLPSEPPEKGFKFHIWLNAGCFPDNTTKLNVFFFENTNLTFNPKSFVLERNTAPKLITVTRLPNSSTLVEIVAKVTGDGATEIQGVDQPVNFGFRTSLKFSVPDQINGGDKRGLMVRLVDEQGKPVALKAPAFVRLVASNATLCTAEGCKADLRTLDVPLQTGANATPPLTLIPEKLFLGGIGSVQAELHANTQYVLAGSEPQEFAIPVALSMQFIAAILGGLLNAIYGTLKILADDSTEKWRDVLAKMGIGVVGGIVAVLFADKIGALGIKLQQTSVVAYVALGFLISYIGIDTFFAKIRPGTTSAATPPAVPTISAQPASQNVASGQNATLKVVASGSGSLAYQWYKGNKGDISQPVQDAKSDTLSTASHGSYWVRVTNTKDGASASVDSDTATVQ